jgi:hypothetical protein
MIEGSRYGPDPDPYLCLMDPDPGGSKTCGSGGSGFGSGSETLENSQQNCRLRRFSCFKIEKQRIGTGIIEYVPVTGTSGKW